MSKNPDSIQITLAGNATVLIEGGGARVITDPWLSERIGPWRRWRPAALEASCLADVDAVLISHAHPDHLDLGTLSMLPPGTPVLTPGGTPLRRLCAAGYGSPRALREWEEESVGALRITAVPSVHTRWCLGYVIDLNGRRVYFAGDAGPHTPFGEISRRCGPIDVALMPVGGSSLAPAPLQRHLTPDLAARATAVLRPRVVIPMHWAHVPCIPAALDRFRGTPARFAEALRQHAPGTTLMCPDDGVPVSL